MGSHHHQHSSSLRNALFLCNYRLIHPGCEIVPLCRGWDPRVRGEDLGTEGSRKLHKVVSGAVSPPPQFTCFGPTRPRGCHVPSRPKAPNPSSHLPIRTVRPKVRADIPNIPRTLSRFCFFRVRKIEMFFFCYIEGIFFLQRAAHAR